MAVGKRGGAERVIRDGDAVPAAVDKHEVQRGRRKIVKEES